MSVLLSLVLQSAEKRSIDPGTAWTIIVTLAGVIGAMALFVVKREGSRSREISRVKDACAAEVKELMQEQIKELRDHRELADTLIKVIDRTRAGG